MRRAALILMLSMIAPSIQGVVCGARCVKHRNAAAATAEGCHDHSSSHHVAFTDAAAGVCHVEADSAVATATDRLAPKAASAIDHHLPVALSYAQDRVGRPTHTFTPSPTVLTTIQLRI